MNGAALLVVPLAGIPEVREGDDLARLLLAAVRRAGVELADGDVLAVTSKVRLPQLKDVPTLAETVLPNFEASTWYGIYAPKGTPQPVLDKVQAAYQKVMADRAFTDKMAEQAIQLLPAEQYTGAALGKHTESEVARWKTVAAKTNISLD